MFGLFFIDFLHMPHFRDILTPSFTVVGDIHPYNAPWRISIITH
jgi:hypothetical protein